MAKFTFNLGGLHFEQATSKELGRVFDEFEEAKERAKQRKASVASVN